MCPAAQPFDTIPRWPLAWRAGPPRSRDAADAVSADLYLVDLHKFLAVCSDSKCTTVDLTLSTRLGRKRFCNGCSGSNKTCVAGLARLARTERANVATARLILRHVSRGVSKCATPDHVSLT